MRDGMPEQPRPSASTIHQLKLMLGELNKLLQRQDVKMLKFGFTELKLSTYGLKDIGKLGQATSPSGALIVITSVMLQKITAAAGVATDDQRVKCADALAALGGDLATAAVLGPETAGLGSVVPLLFAALDSYKMANQCFLIDGMASHAVGAR